MEEDDERIGRYLDNEMSDDEAAAFEAELAVNEELRARLRKIATAIQLAREAFEHVLREPVPDHIMSAVSATAPRVVSLRPRLLSRNNPTLAMAASLAGLAIGLGLGLVLNPPGIGASGSEVAGLAYSLDRVASGQIFKGSFGTIRPLVTFPRVGGGWCREYEIGRSGNSGVVGIACREGPDGWRILAQQEAERIGSGDGSKFAPADGSRVLDALADRLMAGNRLSSAQEADLIARRWSTR